MTQETIRHQFGDPIQKSTFQKSDNHVWGPLENIWYGLPDGSAIHVWNYETEDGNTELYFLNGATTVFSKGFISKGVVYESNGT